MPESDLPFSLLPDEDVPPSPDDAVSAAVSAALGGPVEVSTGVRAPLGRSWALDPEGGGFLRRGGSEPTPVGGLGALVSWCQMVVHSERRVHRIFSDAFGVEGFAAAIGRLPSAAITSGLAASLERALLQHDRISAVENVSISLDPTTGTVVFDAFTIVLDDQSTLLFGNITIQAG